MTAINTDHIIIAARAAKMIADDFNCYMSAVIGPHRTSIQAALVDDGLSRREARRAASLLYRAYFMQAPWLPAEVLAEIKAERDTNDSRMFSDWDEDEFFQRD